MFIKTDDSITFYDWASPQNDDLRGNSTNTDLARLGACAVGYHIPTKEEWVGLFTAYAREKGNDTYNGENVTSRPAQLTIEDTVNDLLLPLAGRRNRVDGNLFGQNTIAHYRTSTPNGTNAYSMHFLTNGFYPQNTNNRAYSLSLRCFKNTVPKPLVGDISYSTTTATNQDVVATLTLNRAGTVLES
jgi:uncharacterized protein (TIGR02145 family)